MKLGVFASASTVLDGAMGTDRSLLSDLSVLKDKKDSVAIKIINLSSQLCKFTLLYS